MKKILATLIGLTLLALPFTANAIVIPTGRAYQGNLSITTGTVTDNTTESNIVATSTAGMASTTVASATGFAAGQYAMIVQMSGSGAGQYEFQLIRSVVGNSLFFYNNLSNQYDKDSTSTAQVIKVSEYNNVNISGGTWTAPNWNGTTGGILVAFLTGSLTQTGGTIAAPSGFNGGSGGTDNAQGGQGQGTGGNAGSSSGANGNGAGGGTSSCSDTGAGGGGGNANAGSTGGASGCDHPGAGGNAVGVSTLALLTMGGAGGGGGCDYNVGCTNGSGGNGTGDIFIESASTTISGGSLTANGNAGGTCGAGTGGGGGGAGAGGAVRLPVRLALNVGSSNITASSASGGSTNCISGGGSSSTGFVATVSAATVTGASTPTINTSSTDYVYNVDNTAVTMTLGSSF